MKNIKIICLTILTSIALQPAFVLSKPYAIFGKNTIFRKKASKLNIFNKFKRAAFSKYRIAGMHIVGITGVAFLIAYLWNKSIKAAEETLNTATSAGRKTLDDKENLEKSKNAEIEKLRKDHATTLTEKETDKNNALDKLRAEIATALASKTTELEKLTNEHKTLVEKLNAEHKTEIQEAKKNALNEFLAELKKLHKDKAEI